ncbi:MAG TPA: carboxypeptidase-like regulatory domain-containing protein, partial [Terriglobales bacterium]|nr:carboxypeptidase-like regulatory domain-containing protein [Terriglobales bacterium]
MRMRPLRLLCFPILAVVCFSGAVKAQTTTSGGLTGVVTDRSGAMVPNADVEIRDIAKGTGQATRTDHEGMYRFFFLAPARYLLTVTHDGFRKESRTVNVLLGPAATVNVALEIANTSAEITVTGEAPVIQAENGDAS